MLTFAGFSLAGGGLRPPRGVAIACPYAELARVSGEERFYDAIAQVDATGNLLKNYRKTNFCNRRVAGQLQ